eukprot:CAMPEP_0114651944 /NCGR_PEP_ID=MMETSP0191-20121206/8676_1 /TAXON_ID=126664 /ORGANISM="Sorites sp." /LENGTH=368 /DNA_ID=CAMNT_0001866317 /DNA_START=86 /DNA_END=1192 /DNA_ORIENTATION=-
MPIYEEKVISPFAIHFTQEHIKTHFQDGRVVEETVSEIQLNPSDGKDFDLILKAPFPNIEILRWQPPHCGDREAKNWFTLDNRRLYCLQRMAAEHWPKRVGAVVDILYADTGRVRKKYDSSTQGRSVTISPSVKVPALRRWDWRVQIAQSQLVDPDEVAKAMEAVNRDCAKPSVQDLCDVPGPAFETMLKDQTADFVSSLAALLSTTRDQCQPAEGEGTALASPTESTAASEGSAESRQGTPREAPVTKVNMPSKLMWKPKGTKPEGATVATDNQENCVVESSSLEEEVIEQVRTQLSQPGSKGFVWIENWNERYHKELGNLRAFLESKTDCFVVKPGKGRGYRVEALQPAAKQVCGMRWKKSGKTAR